MTYKLVPTFIQVTSLLARFASFLGVIFKNPKQIFTSQIIASPLPYFSPTRKKVFPRGGKIFAALEKIVYRA